MSFVTPKTDWDTDDGVTEVDLNRIEGNTLQNNTDIAANKLEVETDFSGFGFKRGIKYNANTGTLGAYVIRVDSGYMSSQSAVKGVFGGTFSITKLLSADVWVAGTGAASPCRVAGSAAIGANQWWYVFVLYNPSTSAFDVCMDDNYAGSNIQGSAITTAGYTMWRRVACQFEMGVAGYLWNTLGRMNRFYVAAAEANKGDTEAVSATTDTGITLDNASLAGNPYMIPNVNFPVFLEVQADSGGFGASRVSVWSPLHDFTSLGNGMGRTMLIAVNERHVVEVLPSAGYQIRVRSTLAIDFTYSVFGWIDEATD